jgi:hypothetical protein
MGALALVHWRTAGQDRLYVNAPGGRTLGHEDRVTHQVHVEDEHDRQAVLAALHPSAGTPCLRSWAKGGHRRLYVADRPGTKDEARPLGWGDVTTGAVTAEPGQDPAVVAAALSCHRDWAPWTPAVVEPAGSARPAGKAPGLLRRLLGA